uniref:Uncharacterized protein n=1 Tax=Arundo donax TaxID=35708 RepID=A0A0A9E3B6_ARUDO
MINTLISVSVKHSQSHCSLVYSYNIFSQDKIKISTNYWVDFN